MTDASDTADEGPLLFSLDTNVHQGWQFNYQRDVPAQLVHLAAESKVRHVTTSIIEREVKAHMATSIDDAAAAVKHFRRNAYALSSLAEYDVLFRRLDKQALTNRLREAYDEFATELQTQVVDLTQSTVEPVFTDYFAAAAPFEPSKKSEFPDAFHVSALGHWAESSGRSVYVVSGDVGMRDACRPFRFLAALERPEQLLEVVATRTKVEGVRKVHVWLDTHADVVVAAITEHFEGLGFLLVEDGDVNEVRVTHVELGDLSVTSLDDGFAEVSGLVGIEFQADVSYTDPNTGIYDSEEGVLWGQDTVERTLERGIQSSATFEVRYDEPPAGPQDVMVVRLDEDKDVVLDASDG